MKILAHRLFALFLLLALAGCGSTGWFSDDEDDPTAPVELPDIEESVKIRRAWSVGIGDGQGEGRQKLQPVVEGDAIYVASADGLVRALERKKGKTLWKADLDRSLSGGVGAGAGALFVGSSEGEVLRLDAASGAVTWSTRLRGEILAAPQSDGRIVVAQTYDGKIQGLDFDSGKLLWTYDSNVPVLTLRGTSTPILHEGNVYAGFANGRVLALESQTGDIVWEVRVAIPQGRSEIERIVDVDGSMLLAGNELYAASYQGRIVGIEVSSGRKFWQEDISSVSGVGMGFGNIYVADDAGSVHAFYRNGQGTRWIQGALGYRQLSRPTPVSSWLAVVDFEGYLHLMSQLDGEFVGRVKVDGDGARADMISEGNRLYVYGNSGKLVAYDIAAED